MPPKTTYHLKDPVLPKVFEELTDLNPLTKQLLWNRNIEDVDSARHFLNPDYDSHLHDPFLMTDMDVAVARVLNAISQSERVAIYSDYDCDGIPGGVVLHDFFSGIGFTNFENYIPHRHQEGFGFNTGAVAQLAERDVKLIITIDCGTSDHEAVLKAKELGIDVVVTDHHEPNGHLPEAHAILNPKRDDAYPFKELCGAGVVYKLVQALITEGKKQEVFVLGDGQEKWLLDMVGLATMADMVPLTGENRVFAHYGLRVLRKSRRPGLQHLFRKTRTSQYHLTEDDIGFTIAPRINAASRMDTPEDAFHMLATKDEVDAGTRVAHLEQLNNERKGVVAAMAKEIKKRIGALAEIPPIIVMGNPDWRPSLVGLAANTLAETYKRPAFLWGRDGQGIIKGSCRSDGVQSVVAIMEEARDSFLEFGGHHGAGGFSVGSEQIHTLSESLGSAYTKLSAGGVLAEQENFIDADLSLDDIDDALLRTLRTLAPYGEGNSKPLFRFQKVIPVRVEVFGKTKNHTRVVFNIGDKSLEAIAFFKMPDDFLILPEEGKALTLIAHVEESFFMNQKQRRLRIVDII